MVSAPLKAHRLTVSLAVLLTLTGTASAQTSGSAAANAPAAPISRERPFLASDGPVITDVVDAGDGEHGVNWSFRISAGYTRSQRTATLQRELSTLSEAGVDTSASGLTPFGNVARYTQITQRIDFLAEFGVWHDLSLFLGLPLIVEDSRRFTDAGEPATSAARLRDGFTVDGAATQLFSLPFDAPTRAGIDYLRIGAAWDILNQSRDPHLPTWLLRFEWRPPVGPGLRPCVADGSRITCPGNRDSAWDPMFAPGTNTFSSAGGATYPRPQPAGINPGISRRMHSIAINTILSRRWGFITPYGGLDALIELPEGTQERCGFGADRCFGQTSAMPPIQGALIAGMEIVPWENRETWQRFTIDVRARAGYASPGRDYSPLYDPLGASNSLPLSLPTWAINDLESRQPNRAVYFSGTTTLQANARVGGYIGVTVQPHKIVRLTLGTSFEYRSPHLITSTDACNPNERPSVAFPGQDLQFRGGCVGDASPDPLHRGVIDTPGNRFRFVDDFTWDLNLNVAVTPRF